MPRPSRVNRLTNLDAGASGITALLLPLLGWRTALAAYAGLGIAWAVPFYFLFRNRPAEHPLVNPGERGLIASAVAPAA